MFYNYILIILCFIIISIYITIFNIPLSYSIQNETLDLETLNESIKIIDKKINLSKIPDPSTMINNMSSLSLTEINKEPIDSNELSDKILQNLSQKNNLSNTLDNKYSELPIINKKWSGLDIYSAAEVRGKANQSLRPINPPDVSIAVGKDHVAQVVHSSIQIWNKNGLILDKKLLHDLFNISKDHYITDPKILYDNTSARWFATIVDGGKEEIKNGSSYYTCLPFCNVKIAVSENDDPTQNWSLFSINATKLEHFPDYPQIAIGKFYFIMTTIEFPVSDESKSLHKTYKIDKNIFIEKNSTKFSSPISSNFPYYPISSLNPSNYSSTVALFKENISDLYSPVREVRINDFYSPTAPVNNKVNEISVPKLYPAPAFKQPLLNLINNQSELKILSAVRNDTSVWIGLHSACQPISISNYSCINILRFDKINVTGSGDPQFNYKYDLTENTQYHIKDTDVYYPAIGISGEGNLFFISGFSNATTFPSLRVSHLAAENQTNDKILILGSAINNSTSYGDYFGSAVDPIDGTVWLSGQYVDQSIPIPHNFPLAQIDKVTK